MGEVRGAEIVDMLAGFNTGHEGGCGTLHANSATAVPDRIAALGLAAGMTLPGIIAQLSAGLEVVIHLARTPAGRRVVAAVGMVVGHDGAAVVEPALVHRGRGVGTGACRCATGRASGRGARVGRGAGEPRTGTRGRGRWRGPRGRVQLGSRRGEERGSDVGQAEGPWIMGAAIAAGIAAGVWATPLRPRGGYGGTSAAAG